MGFTLRLGFAGQCLFVPEVVKGELKKIHVLLPYDAGHKAVLISDSLPPASSSSTSQAEDSPPGLCDPPEPPSTDVPPQPEAMSPRRSIAGCVIDLSAVRTESELDGVPKGVARLGGLASVPRAMVADGYGGKDITARITFAAGDSRIHRCAKGGKWWFRGKERHLAIRVVRKIQAKGEELVLPAWRIDTFGKCDELRLRPRDGKLDLWFFHSPPGDLPKELPPRTYRGPYRKGVEAPHFGGFEDLLLLRRGRHTPVFREPEHPDNGPFPDCYYPKPGLPGLDLFCIGATAPLAK